MNRCSSMAVKQKHPTAPAAVNTACKPSTATATEAAGVQEEFEAIEQAVLATARGRWFLSEYLRRHQNDETRRLVKALRRLAQATGSVAGSGDAMAQQAALEGIRLLLAQTADTLARHMSEGSASCPLPEPTLPEAAAGRLALLLGELAQRPETGTAALPLLHLQDTFRQMARLLGEQQPQASPAEHLAVTEEGITADDDLRVPTGRQAPHVRQKEPDKPQAAARQAGQTGTENGGQAESASARAVNGVVNTGKRASSPVSPEAVKPQHAPSAHDDAQQRTATTSRSTSGNSAASTASTARNGNGRRIVIRRKERSQELHIPLPEENAHTRPELQAAQPAAEACAENARKLPGAPAKASARGSMVRIRTRKGQ